MQQCIINFQKKNNRISDARVQVVWSNSREIGCGYHFCPTVTSSSFTNAYYLVCNYGPASAHYTLMGTRSLGITSGSGRIRFVGLYSAAPIGGGAYWAITTHNVRDGLDAAVATRLVHRGGSRK